VKGICQGSVGNELQLVSLIVLNRYHGVVESEPGDVDAVESVLRKSGGFNDKVCASEVLVFDKETLILAMLDVKESYGEEQFRDLRKNGLE
jgi:hypothetical protein